MKVKFIGEHPADLPTIGLHVEPNQEIEVDDSFEHPLFVAVKAKRGGESTDAVTE